MGGSLTPSPTLVWVGTSVMAIFFLSKDSRICCSSFWVRRESMGTGTSSLGPGPPCQAYLRLPNEGLLPLAQLAP